MIAEMEPLDQPAEDAMTQIASLTDAFFRAVSFPHGGRPDYGRIRGLFINAGLLIKNTADPPDVSTVEQFIAPRLALVEAGRLTSFEEAELDHRTEVFGRVAHRLSTYVKRAVTDGASTEVRGVISTQFVDTSDGWRISSMAWDDERPGLTVPELS